MAQTIVTLCDLHLGQGVETNGQTYTVTLSLPDGSKTQTRELDLCPECSKVVTDLALVLAEHGRVVEQDLSQRVCPTCGFLSQTPVGLASHARSQHGATLAELRGRPLPYACEVPDCGKSFATPQGRGAHKARAHKVNGVSKDAKPVKTSRTKRSAA